MTNRHGLRQFDGDKTIEITLLTDFDTTILVPWLPRSNPLSIRDEDIHSSGLGSPKGALPKSTSCGSCA